MSAEPSVVRCEACTGSSTSDCIDGICAIGFAGFDHSISMCSACDGDLEYQDESGQEECKICAIGYGVPVIGVHTGCNDDLCQLPHAVPTNSEVTLECSNEGPEGSLCPLQCIAGFNSTYSTPFSCHLGENNTMQYIDGDINCTGELFFILQTLDDLVC